MRAPGELKICKSHRGTDGSVGGEECTLKVMTLRMRSPESEQRRALRHTSSSERLSALFGGVLSFAGCPGQGIDRVVLSGSDIVRGALLSHCFLWEQLFLYI